MRKVLLLALPLILAGCTSLPGGDAPAGDSIVQNVSYGDAEFLTYAITNVFVDAHKDEPPGAIFVSAPEGDTLFTPMLVQRLRRSGFTVLNRKAEGADWLRYQVGPLGAGLMMRLRINDHEATVYYDRAPTGELLLNKPMVVRTPT